jgi:hypothetical protein
MLRDKDKFKTFENSELKDTCGPKEDEISG